ncbi:lysozyme inhibitor LprI family protein [Paraburkholderia sediminicola]|uniref:lysozyme inhibitor LprI family protein n=1 Tax=Paraburkholderia sediminicola TaxID=458836 RepID=UPI0038B8E90F
MESKRCGQPNRNVATTSADMHWQPEAAICSPPFGTMTKRQYVRSIQRYLCVAIPAAAMAASASAFAASFDCNRARLYDEKAVCASRQLSELDVEMSVRYQMLIGLVAMGARANMQDEQHAWLETRKQCGENQSCLAQAYLQRINSLKEEYAHLASRGPF